MTTLYSHRQKAASVRAASCSNVSARESQEITRGPFPADKLDQVLHCAEMIQGCNDRLQSGSEDPIWTLVGVMDWAAELHRLRCGASN